MTRQRISERAAGYMELAGAQKDGDCQVVEVDGGISQDLGCCNVFGLKSGKPKEFRCGTCEYVVSGQGEYDSEPKQLTKDNTRGLSLREILDSELPVGG